jgi:hypothetical protein
VLEVGAAVSHGGRKWTVAGIEAALADGARIWLADTDGDGSLAVFALASLLRDPGFSSVDGPRLRVPQVGLLSTAPEEQQLRALELERHVREVETGCPVPGSKAAIKPQYDPASTTLAEREQAKADELAAQGWSGVSRATVRRWRTRYHTGGVWGLVVKRRGATRLDRADPKVVEALRALLPQEALRSRSRGWKKRMRRETQWWLDARHGAGVVEVPATSTFNKLIDAVEASLGLQGTVAQRRARAARPAPPFTPTLALRPGEIVMMDSSPLDALVVLDDGMVGRLELTTAVDVAMGGLWGVLRPAGSKLTDVAVLLAQMMAPVVMRPGWDAALSMAASVVPHERLTAVDERLKDAAARPVIVPETVVVDQGKVFVSPATRAACESLGISLQPVPPANGPAKGHVERCFGSINTEFVQWLPGFTGSHVGERGSRIEQERLWTVSELQALWEEFLVHWHHRPHEGLRHPLMPKKALTPNQMWAALLPVAGYVPVPLSADDFVELLPVRWQAEGGDVNREGQLRGLPVPGHRDVHITFGFADLRTITVAVVMECNVIGHFSSPKARDRVIYSESVPYQSTQLAPCQAYGQLWSASTPWRSTGIHRTVSSPSRREPPSAGTGPRPSDGPLWVQGVLVFTMWSASGRWAR